MNFLSKKDLTKGIILTGITALLITGCGSNSSKEAGGSDSSGLNPASGSAAASALKYWQRLQDGDYPLLVTAYDIRVIHALGASNVIGASVTSRSLITEGNLVKLQSEKTPLGKLVTFTFQTKSNIKNRYSYLMKRRGKEWAITYDTLLAGNLSSYVRDSVLERADRSNKLQIAQSEKTAAKAASTVARRYRTLFVPKRYKLKE